VERYGFVSDPAAYFVTFSIVEWLPVFVTEAPCKIITDSFNFCHANKNLRISAYVIMPTHLHAIVFDSAWDAKRLEQTLIDMRKFTGRRLIEYSFEHGPPSFREVFKANAGDDRQHRCWQPTRHPEAITSEWFWKQKLDYLHLNPCRKGLVKRAAEWRFSSAGYYASDGVEPCDVTISPLEF
jgi:REP-associated tyrosine transposase